MFSPAMSMALATSRSGSSEATRSSSGSRPARSVRRPWRLTGPGEEGAPGPAWPTTKRPSSASVVYAPGAGAREKQIEKGKAEQDRRIAHVDCGEETLWRMSHEIGDRHHSAQQERDGPGQKA